MLLLTRVINLEWEETLSRLFDHIQFWTPFGPVKWGSFFRSCSNQSGSYCDWNSNGRGHGSFYSWVDPVTRVRCGLFSNTLLHSYMYIYLLCMGGLILTISPFLIFTGPKEGPLFHRTKRILVTEWVWRVSKESLLILNWLP